LGKQRDKKLRRWWLENILPLDVVEKELEVKVVRLLLRDARRDDRVARECLKRAKKRRVGYVA